MQNIPQYGLDKYKCPHCLIMAKQDWFSGDNLNKEISEIYKHEFLGYRGGVESYNESAIKKFLVTVQKNLYKHVNNRLLPKNLSIARCQACDDFSIWVDEKIIYPKSIPIELANEDMDDDIKELYNEAKSIFLDSPKGATALLRLSLQKLLIQIGKDGKNINNNIKELVQEGLNTKVQKALDILRVVGNNAVHPGQIDLDDNKDIALNLFKILNLIADEMITKPKELDSLYEEIIPEEIKEHINIRDGVNN
jgi:hypothetical protein